MPQHSAEAPRSLSLGLILESGATMPTYVHGVVQQTTDDEHITVPPAQEKAPWVTDAPARHMSAASCQMPDEHAVAQFRPRIIPDAGVIGCSVTYGCNDQHLVAGTNLWAELPLRPREDGRDVIPRRPADPISGRHAADSRPAARAVNPATNDLRSSTSTSS